MNIEVSALFQALSSIKSIELVQLLLGAPDPSSYFARPEKNDMYVRGERKYEVAFIPLSD